MNHENTKERTVLKANAAKHETGKMHELKAWPVIFKPMLEGLKKFDYRKDDRGFQTGDLLLLKEWDPDNTEYTGRKLLFSVTYILRGGQFGIPEGYIIMGVVNRLLYESVCKGSR